MSNTKQKPAPQAVLAYLSERTSEKGRQYFVGWGGHCKFLLFKTDKIDKFGNRVWTLNVQQCEVKPGTFRKVADEHTSEKSGSPVSGPSAPDPPPERRDFRQPLTPRR